MLMQSVYSSFCTFSLCLLAPVVEEEATVKSNPKGQSVAGKGQLRSLSYLTNELQEAGLG